MSRHIIIIAFTLLISAMSAYSQTGRRRINPVNNAATMTQAINEALTDSTRILEARKARSTHYHDDDGRIVYIDTITGEQWIDSTALIPVVKMQYPLFHSVAVGVDIWDAAMRAFGQHYGLGSVWAELNLHNRYIPVAEFGLGTASNTPSGNNFSYHSPVAPFFKIGLNYNFLYNSSPDYQFYAGLRYGVSSFSYSVNDVTLDAGYWGEDVRFNIPSQNSTAGYLEFHLGLRVKLWGPISAGWSIKYHKILHESGGTYGKAWYIPGYGARGQNLTGSFSVSYSFSIDRLNKARPAEVIDTEEPISDI